MSRIQILYKFEGSVSIDPETLPPKPHTTLSPAVITLFILSLATTFLQCCRYELPPVQPLGHRFTYTLRSVALPMRLDFDGRRKFYAKEGLRRYGLPLRNQALCAIVADGHLRVDGYARLSAMELLADRKCKCGVAAIEKWITERPNFPLEKLYSLTAIDPKKYPPQGLKDLLSEPHCSSLDSIQIAESLARLHDPELFAVIKNNIEGKAGWNRVQAVQALWYFWPYQGQSIDGRVRIDLYPLMRVALMDSDDQVFGRAAQQYDYAPCSPRLKADLEQVLADSISDYRYIAAQSILVHRYHRKEKDFPKDIRSYWSRRKRTYME